MLIVNSMFSLVGNSEWISVKNKMDSKSQSQAATKSRTWEKFSLNSCTCYSKEEFAMFAFKKGQKKYLSVFVVCTHNETKAEIEGEPAPSKTEELNENLCI